MTPLGDSECLIRQERPRPIARVAVDGPRGPALSLDLIPALDDGSGIGGLEERPVAKPARAPRTAAARAARSP